MKAPECRYKCGRTVTHQCVDCAGAQPETSGFYCTNHAERHDEAVRFNGGSVFAQPIERPPWRPALTKGMDR